MAARIVRGALWVYLSFTVIDLIEPAMYLVAKGVLAAGMSTRPGGPQ